MKLLMYEDQKFDRLFFGYLENRPRSWKTAFPSNKVSTSIKSESINGMAKPTKTVRHLRKGKGI